MVETITEPRSGLGSGHGAACSSGALGEGCQQRGRSPFARARATASKERLPQGLAGRQPFCSVQRGF